MRHAGSAARRRGIQVLPVYFAGGSFYPAHLTPEGLLSATGGEAAGGRIRSRVGRDPVAASISTREKSLKEWIHRQAARAPASELLQTLYGPWRWFRGIRRARRAASRHAPVTFAPGDTMLSVDLTLDRYFVGAFLALRDHGVRLASVVYDIAPIRFPHQVPARFLTDFRHWVDGNVAGSDLVIAISATVRNDLAEYFAGRAGAPCPAGRRLAWFHLGQDLDRALPGGAVRDGLTRIFDSPDAGTVLLMVGWLHPRKNHLLVLGVLEQLRREGISVRLIVIGRRDISADEFYRRVRSSPELVPSVFVFHDATDTELAFCYRRASALVYPSISEGFGLPLVEALGNGLPVFASDIPIFREIGEGFVSFFPLSDAGVLARKLRRFCVERAFDAPRPATDFHWPTWSESVDRLLDIVQQGDVPADSA